MHSASREKMAGACESAGRRVVLLVSLLVFTSTIALAAPAEKKESALDLRVRFNGLFCEYALLSWSAILTAGDKRQDAFKAAAAALEENGKELSRVFSQVYGDRAGSDFVVLWKRHIGAILDFAVASARRNTAGQDQATRFLLDGYSTQFGSLIGRIAGSPADEVTRNTRVYLTHLKSVAAAHALSDYNNEYRALDQVYEAVSQMARDESTFAVRASPARFVGSVDAPAADLRVRLGSLCAQQMFTLAMANRSIAASNMDEYYALLARSDMLTDDMARLLRGYGGNDFGSAFSTTWKKYTASLQDFEKAGENKDHSLQKRVIGDLKGLVNEIVAIFVPVNLTREAPRKGKKPKPSVPPAFRKDVQAFVDANLDIIRTETRGVPPFGLMRRAWNETRRITDRMSELVVTRFGAK